MRALEKLGRETTGSSVVAFQGPVCLWGYHLYTLLVPLQALSRYCQYKLPPFSG